MSLHSNAKRLAVLVDVIENSLSIREAARAHSVCKTSIEKWLREHRAGKTTINHLRNITTIAPRVGSPSMAHGPLRHMPQVPSPVVRRQRDEMIKYVEAEREKVVAFLAALDAALEKLRLPLPGECPLDTQQPR